MGDQSARVDVIGATVEPRVRPDTFEWGSADDDRRLSDLADLQAAFRRELPAETVDPGNVGRGALPSLGEADRTQDSVTVGDAE